MTNGTGFDAIPVMFRRPIVQVNDVPVGYAYTWGNKPILLFKHHIDKKTRQELRLNEIFANNVAYALSTDDFAKHDIALIENSSEEIKAAVIEMDERLNGTWKAEACDEMFQNKFLDICFSGVNSTFLKFF